MFRSLFIRPPFPLSHIFRKSLSTTAPISFPESYGLLPTSQSPITPKPHFFNAVSTAGNQLPAYRVIDGVGKVIEGAELPEVCLSAVTSSRSRSLLRCQLDEQLARGMFVLLAYPKGVSLKELIVTRTWSFFLSLTTYYIAFSVRARYPSMYVLRNYPVI